MKPGINELYFAAEKLHDELTEYVKQVSSDELQEHFYEIAGDVSENKCAFSDDIRKLMKTLIKMGEITSDIDSARIVKTKP